MNDEEFLEHIGIMGMHWGHKKGKTQPNEKPTKPIKEKNYSEDYKKKTNLKKKKVNEMSNSELKTLNERLQLEKQYKDLTKQDVSPGKKFVMDVLKDLAKETLKSGLKSGAKVGIKGAKKVIKSKG